MGSLSVEITVAVKKGNTVLGITIKGIERKTKQHSAECKSIVPLQILNAMHF